MATERMTPAKIRCDACPVMCFIAEGKIGACDRYANHGGDLVRLDPLTIIENTSHKLVPFMKDSMPEDWDGNIVQGDRPFVTAVGAGTTYPDYKPAPFIVSQEIDGVDMVTVVTEGIFSYCGVKVKIDTDRHIGHERDVVRVGGEPIGHVMTSEYGSKMLSLGGVEHLTGGSKKEGRMTCDALLRLCNREPVEMQIGEEDHTTTLVVEAGKPPLVNGMEEKLMRVGCGSATIGMFPKQWVGHVDEVVVVDDHITGVLSEHQTGKMLEVAPTGIKIKGRKSTPGRYFQVAKPGTGWGGTDIEDPLTILGPFNPKIAWEGLSLLMVSTTGEQFGYFVLDADLMPQPAEIPARLKASADLIAENCEPSICSVLFMGGAGGSLRAGVTENPVRLTRSVKDSLTFVSCGGAESYVWPGGGITVMVDVLDMPTGSFGYVPTPALVAPIEFTMRVADYATLGGHMDEIKKVSSIVSAETRKIAQRDSQPDPMDRTNYRWAKERR
ncbi:6-hydroxynicotinate reductase [Parasedimentitalea psychrophila]|uniref:6-hydroxynicotinate reductase n=1 Tax=Parasedimentitalea psychrophila TaxID=2997337 RepID=A0A9Y2P7I7_9RHOB|nr:6-hydroxynicotinate reductase [Parasedimentitalea psychrophila]WIY25860.1 6-hydroxynicotinate reductase [Parasedimentitalea psychrophila]